MIRDVDYQNPFETRVDLFIQTTVKSWTTYPYWQMFTNSFRGIHLPVVQTTMIGLMTIRMGPISPSATHDQNNKPHLMLQLRFKFCMIIFLSQTFV